jgi:pimeloyl-ACP methyl ester carboxylesterase
MVLLGAGALLLGGGYAAGALRESAAAARLRVAGRSRTIPTEAGALEYAVAGRGPPVLMLHGTGGGFDQGLRFGAALQARGVQIVAPSRFGYLGSDFPGDASPAAQADALVALLDALGIEAIPVIGGSAGALPAAQFALRHPRRCTHLVLLVPAMNLENRDPVEFTAAQAFFVERLLGSDLWFGAALKLAPDALMRTLLATEPALLPGVSPAERERARLILAELMPVSAKTQGLLNDAFWAGHPADIDLGSLRVPTLVMSAEDDLFGTAGTARTIAGRVPGAELLMLPDGGHIWLGHDEEVAGAIAAFLGLAPG